MRRVILRSFQSPGDILMLTAAVRDLHLANPGRFQTDVRTAADALWQNNPHLTPLREGDSGVESIDMHYPLIHQANQRPYHFIHGYPQFMEQALGVRVPLTRFAADIHLTAEEKQLPPPGTEDGVPERYWIMMAGGKYDFTAKWWNPAAYQAVVDHFQGRVTFVQCGEKSHWHPPLKGVVNLIGKTSIRDFIRLMYHADGVVCPVTFAMHLAAAVETKPGRPKNRACVVIAGGREPAQWEAYPHHQYLSTNGALNCCADGGCWKSRCQLVGDGDRKDQHDLCVDPVQVSADLRIPRCLDLITPEQVIQRIQLYYDGGALRMTNGHVAVASPAVLKVTTQELSRETKIVIPAAEVSAPKTPAPAAISNGKRKSTTAVRFHHGLGDAVYFAHLIPLYTRRGYQIEVECTPDKRILFEAAGATCVDHASLTHDWAYPAGKTHEGQGRFWQGSKMGHNISATPLPHLGRPEDLWNEFCGQRIDIGPYISEEVVKKVDDWCSKLPGPIVLFHSKGNTGQERKSLPDPIALDFYQALLEQTDASLVLLDWDHRVPRLASYRVRHLDDYGPCSTAEMFALMRRADLMIGIDSGPLHAARFTSTPTIGVWMPGHYPSTYTLPRSEQLNVVLADHTKTFNRYKRIPWNIVEHPGGSFRGDLLAGYCAQMLGGTKYLGPQLQAAELQLQQFIREFCRPPRASNGSEHRDRNNSFDKLFREIRQRFPQPLIVETGTIRAAEDWSGAGFFTYLAGSYVHRMGGRLHSCDINPTHCKFAKEWTSVFVDCVVVHERDSVEFLNTFPDKIDVLYLDSLDTTEPLHAEHAQRELTAALPRLHERSIVVFDDTPWQDSGWQGKGAQAVPWLIAHGWHVLYAGYQVVLSRSPVASRPK